MRLTRLLLVPIALLAACTSKEGSAGADGATGGTLVIDASNDAADVFPPYVHEVTGRIVQDQVFEHLADIKDDLVTIGDKGFTPRLATKWEWSADSLSIAFSLDPRARWHDGKPVTAADVRYSLKTFLDPKVGSPVAPVLANVDSVSVKDSLTAVIWFKKHTPEQFYDVAYNLVIFPEHVYGGIPVEQLKTSELTRKPIGSGPFRFVKWETGTRLELIADTANYRGRPKLDRLIFTPVDIPTAATQVLAGQADFMEAFPVDRVAELDSSKVARAIVAPNFGYVFMAMNQYDQKAKNSPHPIFGDVRVRRALSAAVDRQAMLQNVFGKIGRISHGPFPMTVSFADSTIRLPAYDTTAAKAMLDSSGWVVGKDGIRVKNGRPLRFGVMVPSVSLPRRRYAVLMQEHFRKVGAQLDIEVLEPKTTFDRQNAGQYDANMGAFVTDPSPSGVKQNWSTAGIGAAGQNWMRYSNRSVDALLDSVTSTSDPAKMRNAASRAFQTLVNDAPAIFLYDMANVLAVNRRIDVAPMRYDGWWTHLAEWSVPADKRIDRDRIGLRQATP
jgi:peptide/nickel transport system substrate-binding protein